MRDLRDLLSGPSEIERIVFCHRSKHVQYEPAYREEMRRHCYIGALSGDRFLLVEIPSIEVAGEPVDLLTLSAPTMVARTSDTDFYYNGPLVTPQPRSASPSCLENAFRARLHPLRECLQLGLFLARPGSFRWEGDRFCADYSDEMKSAAGTISVGFGENVSESAKDKIFAELVNPPATRKHPYKLAKVVEQKTNADGKVVWSSDGNLEAPAISKPVAGSMEARIVAHCKARHEAKIAKGMSGHLIRDLQGNVSEIRLEQDPWRIELEYAPSADLPLPWPHRIRRILNRDSEPPVPPYEMTIHAAQIAEQPMDDAQFLPWRYLKEETYVRGKALPSGHFTTADPKDQSLLRDLLRRARRR
jgi:hypothetical protein